MDDLSKYKLDMKKEEKEWDRNIPLTTHLKAEIRVMHRVASMVINLSFYTKNTNLFVV